MVVLKTTVSAMAPGVRIPRPPPSDYFATECMRQSHGFPLHAPSPLKWSSLELSHSGLVRLPAKEVGVFAPRGFKSRQLRHVKPRDPTLGTARFCYARPAPSRSPIPHDTLACPTYRHRPQRHRSIHPAFPPHPHSQPNPLTALECLWLHWVAPFCFGRRLHQLLLVALHALGCTAHSWSLRTLLVAARLACTSYSWLHWLRLVDRVAPGPALPVQPSASSATRQHQ